ncbi:hypothetical protein QQG55_37730 [Brugia pahangi]
MIVDFSFIVYLLTSYLTLSIGKDERMSSYHNRRIKLLDSFRIKYLEVFSDHIDSSCEGIKLLTFSGYLSYDL